MPVGGDTMTERTDSAPQVGGHFHLTPWFGLDPKTVFARVEFRPWYDFDVGIRR
jgi:hypothetical protein